MLLLRTRRIRRAGRRSLLLPIVAGQIGNGQRVAALLGRHTDHLGAAAAARVHGRRCGGIAAAAAIRLARVATRTAARNIRGGAGTGAGARTSGVRVVLVGRALTRQPVVAAGGARTVGCAHIAMKLGCVRFATRPHRFDARIGAGLAAFAQRWRPAVPTVRRMIVLASGAVVLRARVGRGSGGATPR